MISVWLLHPPCAMCKCQYASGWEWGLNFVGIEPIRQQLAWPDLSPQAAVISSFGNRGTGYAHRCHVHFFSQATSNPPRAVQWDGLAHTQLKLITKAAPYTSPTGHSLGTWPYHIPKSNHPSFLLLQRKIRNNTICEYHVEAMPCAGTSTKHAGVSGKQTNRGYSQCSTFQLSRTFQPRLIKAHWFNSWPWHPPSQLTSWAYLRAKSQTGPIKGVSGVCFPSHHFHRCGFDCIMIKMWLQHPPCAICHMRVLYQT